MSLDGRINMYIYIYIYIYIYTHTSLLYSALQHFLFGGWFRAKQNLQHINRIAFINIYKSATNYVH